VTRTIAAAVERWRDQGVRAAPALDEGDVLAAAEALRIPSVLLELYRVCNGSSREWFRVLPIEDRTDVKHTWDGLRRANDPRTTRFLGRDARLLDRFLVFAALDAARCAVIDRTDSSIWAQEDDELQQTATTLIEFVGASIRAVNDS
jgi:hypothetical protein